MGMEEKVKTETTEEKRKLADEDYEHKKSDRTAKEIQKKISKSLKREKEDETDDEPLSSREEKVKTETTEEKRKLADKDYEHKKSARTAKEIQKVSKSLKREKEDESDDEPLSSRAEKVKTETTEEKRKLADEDDEDYEHKKSDRTAKDIQKKISKSLQREKEDETDDEPLSSREEKVKTETTEEKRKLADKDYEHKKSARTAKEIQKVSKSLKREKEDESDDEPLSSRAEKVKTETTEEKRKLADEDDEDYEHKKSDRTAKEIQKKISKSLKREKEDETDDEPLSSRLEKVRKVKKETTEKRRKLSDDDEDYDFKKSAPTAKEIQKVSKSLKREKEDESDDEPLSSRLEKVRKMKTETTQKKRKLADDADEDCDYKKPVKKVKKEKEKKPSKSRIDAETASPKKRVKKEDEQEVWKWWEEEKLEEGVKWKTLEHSGPVFAPPYERVPKNVKFYYDGKHMELSEETEEVAGFYGRMLDHDYTTKEVFNTNFFRDWRKVMTPDEKAIITDLKKCNFSAFNEYYKMKTEERKAMTKEDKLKIKEQNEELTQKYGFCIIDGHRQKIGNFKIEPPGLFRGRGEHPKMGMLKKRVHAEDIIINIGKDSPVPEAPDGHKWKEVRHDNTVTWLSSWNENILNSTKYIMLNPSSKLKGEKDWQKYETARKLKNHADRIRQTYSDDFRSKEMKVRQRAVALYFIDKLALRAGNEKDEDTADTVGCCSLRVEHITLHEEKDGQQYVVDFDFLGKDSIRYVNSVPVERRAFKNVKLFMKNKDPGDDLFDRLNTAILNKYLTELMEGLTAKVFRTYNASKTLQEQLDLITKPEMSVPEKMLAYNRANRAVAVLCNHQRAVPKGFSKSMENLKGKMDEKKQQIKDCQKEVKSLKKAYKDSNTAKDKMVYDKKKKRLQQLEEQLKKLEVQATDKEENKQIALGTSKLNYLDPRISVAWCKKWDVPIEKIYNRTQRDKFRWAIEMVGPEYRF